VDSSLQTVVILAMALVILVMASTDLALDVLRVVPDSLPRWQANISRTMTDQHATESPGFGRSARRTLDAVLVVGALLSPVFVLVRNGWDAVALSWSVLLELATLLWLQYLVRRPRRPLPGAVLPDGKSAPKSASKQQKRKRRS